VVLNERWATVRKDVCVLPDGRIIDDYYYWEGGDFAQVLAIDRAGQVVLTQQYKHGVKEVVIELPAGMVASHEEPLDTARRELLEETGFSGHEWRSLGVLNVSSAKATTRAYPFLVLDVVETALPHLDEAEQIRVFLRPLEVVIEMMCSGEIADSNSLSTCLRALRVLGRL